MHKSLLPSSTVAARSASCLYVVGVLPMAMGLVPYSSKFSWFKNFVKGRKIAWMLIFVIKFSWLIATHARTHVKNCHAHKNFREWEVNHENHENIIPRKFGAIRYIVICGEASSYGRSATSWKRASIRLSCTITCHAQQQQQPAKAFRQQQWHCFSEYPSLHQTTTNRQKYTEEKHDRTTCDSDLAASQKLTS